MRSQCGRRPGQLGRPSGVAVTRALMRRLIVVATRRWRPAVGVLLTCYWNARQVAAYARHPAQLEALLSPPPPAHGAGARGCKRPGRVDVLGHERRRRFRAGEGVSACKTDGHGRRGCRGCRGRRCRGISHEFNSEKKMALTRRGSPSSKRDPNFGIRMSSEKGCYNAITLVRECVGDQDRLFPTLF